MITELEVMNALYDVLIRDINDYTPQSVENLDNKNFMIDFPSVDMMPKSTMIYLQPNYSNFEELTLQSDESQFNMAIYILAKKDKSTVLQNKVFDIYNAIYLLLKTNPTLDGAITVCGVESFDYYPAVEANPNVKGIEMSIVLQFEKDFTECN